VEVPCSLATLRLTRSLKSSGDILHSQIDESTDPRPFDLGSWARQVKRLGRVSLNYRTIRIHSLDGRSRTSRVLCLISMNKV
jgi:hypothetical protein